MIGETVGSKSIVENQLHKTANFHTKKIMENRKCYFLIHVRQRN